MSFEWTRQVAETMNEAVNCIVFSFGFGKVGIRQALISDNH
jgi:hypothetical protein